MNIKVLFSLTLALFLVSGGNAAKVTIKNNCQTNIWPATLTGDQKPQLESTGFELGPGQDRSFEMPSPWSGRFWARTRCNNDSAGKFSCQTGDCGSGRVTCDGLSGALPATLIEITVAPDGGQDYYDVSNVDGFNIPVSVSPQGGTGDCQTSTCPVDLNPTCPGDLQVKNAEGEFIGCKSACAQFNEDKYCCRNDFKTAETCPPTDYSMFFEKQCPQAYSYAYDDKNSTFTCFNRPDYLITFCP